MKCINEIFKEITSRLLYKIVVLDIKTRGQRKSNLYIDFQLIKCYDDNYNFIGLNIDEDDYVCCGYEYKLDFPLGILNSIEKTNVNEPVNYNNLIPSQIPKKQYNFLENYVLNFHLDIFCDVCDKDLTPPYLYNHEFYSKYGVIYIDLCISCLDEFSNKSNPNYPFIDKSDIPIDNSNLIFKTKPTNFLNF